MSEKSFPKVSGTINERQTFITEAAIRVIASKGFAGLTVRAVAAEAGCSRGLVEHYFRNKAALISAAHDWANETYLQRVATAVGDLTGLVALQVRLEELLPYSERTLDEWRVRVALWQQEANDAALQPSNRRSFYGVYDEILEDMRCGQAMDEISATVPIEVTSELILMFIVGIATLCLTDTRLRQRKSLDRRVQMILGMLKTGNLSALQVGDPKVDY